MSLDGLLDKRVLEHIPIAAARLQRTSLGVLVPYANAPFWNAIGQSPQENTLLTHIQGEEVMHQLTDLLAQGSYTTQDVGLQPPTAKQPLIYRATIHTHGDEGIAYFTHVDDLVQSARTDSLTGLLNLRGFKEHALSAISTAMRQGDKLSVVRVDLDDFKEVNDTLGHAEGDKVLAEFGVYARKYTRAGDIWGRTGGDEFAAVLANDKTGADHAVNLFRTKFKETQGISFSYGIVQAARTPRKIYPEIVYNNLMDASDQVLYANKQRKHKQ